MNSSLSVKLSCEICDKSACTIAQTETSQVPIEEKKICRVADRGRAQPDK